MLKNKIIVTFFGLSIVLLFISALVGGIGLSGFQGPLILRFDKFANEANLIGDFRTVFGLGGVVSFMVFLNFLLALEVYSRERFLSYIFAAASLIVTLLFLMVVSSLVRLN